MNMDHIKRGGDVVFIAGIPAYFAHFTLPDVYTMLGIIWLGWQILSRVILTVKRWLRR